jgi:hypothetical protein
VVLSWLASEGQYAEAGSGRIVRCSNNVVQMARTKKEISHLSIKIMA